MTDIFTALADSTRRALLDELAERDGQTLFELCARLVTKYGISSSRQAITQHLRVLEDVGLVRTRRAGRYKFHHADFAPLRAVSERWPHSAGGHMIRIGVTSVFVDDQDKAEAFYTGVLGFRVKDKVPLGDDHWLTVVSPADIDGIQLLLEPDKHPATKAYKSALNADGIPAMIFTVDDIDAEYHRLVEHGVVFTQPPQDMGPVRTAVFDDTCGNLIQLNSTVSR